MISLVRRQSLLRDLESPHVARSILLGDTDREPDVAHSQRPRVLRQYIPVRPVRKVDYGCSGPDSSGELLNAE